MCVRVVVVCGEEEVDTEARYCPSGEMARRVMVGKMDGRGRGWKSSSELVSSSSSAFDGGSAPVVSSSTAIASPVVDSFGGEIETSPATFISTSSTCALLDRPLITLCPSTTSLALCCSNLRRT